MKYHEMTKNYIFREFECGLSIEDTAKLCFKSVRTVKDWDNGKIIPKECKRLMRLYTGRQLSIGDDWKGFKLCANKIELPTGKHVSPQEILTGIALLEIQSELEIKVTSKLLGYARELARIRENK
ncbi:regulator [Vibrio europaeus]|uniref:regulator n=1 Tax=Vibrio europaeus TaxID=300876 RepID=UPI00233E5B4E|nr:regulator [Vibrio europaeus]MDC5721971.1 regulator [Vibrio europaeus]MDC5758094.1 regulator [Vibrio europaeus]MDC5776328.1 regulator [Vibrio europaeus]MDC5795478.1 regulator [Vibrio europaeus]MDC5798349.1 regulator [Vibrio europaeus]